MVLPAGSCFPMVPPFGSRFPKLLPSGRLLSLPALVAIPAFHGLPRRPGQSASVPPASNSFPMLPHSLPCRVSSGAATFPHRLPLRFIPPAALRLRAPPIHEDMVVHGLCGRVPDSAGKVYLPDCICPLDCCCSDRCKSVCPSAPIAYATSVSPPDKAIAWPWAHVISNFE